MANEKQYVVENTQPTVLIDNAGKPYDGFVVQITLTQWNEARLLEVRSIDPEEINMLALAEIEVRKALEKLGA